MTRTRSMYLALLAVLLSPMVANADLIDWTIDAAFDDGGILSGMFTVDTDAALVIDWNLLTTAGTTLAGFNYDTTNSSLLGMDNFGSTNSFTITRDDPFAQPYVNLRFFESLFTPGSLTLDTSGKLGGSWECINCGLTRLFTAGSATSVPEPGTLALLGIGLFGMGLARRRRNV